MDLPALPALVRADADLPALPALPASREGGPFFALGGADLRGEIQAAFRDIVLPQIQKDLSELTEGVRDVRRDLQLFSRSPVKVSGVPGSGLWGASPCALDATSRLPRDTLSNHGDNHLALRGQEPSGRRSTSEVSSLRVVASGAARVQPVDITESEEENKEDIEKKVEACRERPPAPINVARPSTPWDPEPSLPCTPPSHSAAPSQAQAMQRNSEEWTTLKKAVPWIQDPPRASSSATDRDSSGGQTPDETASAGRRSKQERFKEDAGSANFQDSPGAAVVTFKSATTQNFETGRNGGQSLANLRVSRAVARDRKTRKTTMAELTMSLFKLETYRNLTAASILTSFRFDNVISLLILANSVTIGLEADYAARNVTESVPVQYRAIEIFFCVVFTTELALRAYVFRVSFFWKRDLAVLWNYFDLLVVGAQLVQELIELMKVSSDDNNAGHLRLLRILRVLRIVRIFRLVRVLHLISELRTIVSSIIGSFRSLFWVVILLLLMMYIVGVWFLQSVTDHFIARLDSGTNGQAITYSSGEEQLGEHFGSLAATILSLWQSLSGGVDWSEMSNPLISELSPLLGFAFAAFIAFAILALMNVVTGVFVQTALHSAEQEEETFLTDQIIGLFHKCKGGDDWGCITEKDLQLRLGDPDMAKEWKNINVSADEATYVFALLDVDGKGEVQFEEFLSACLRLRGSAKSLDVLIQLQESRHAKRVLEDLLSGIGESVARISDSLQGVQHIEDNVARRTALMLSRTLQKEAFRPPKQLDVHVELMTPSTSDDEV